MFKLAKRFNCIKYFTNLLKSKSIIKNCPSQVKQSIGKISIKKKLRRNFSNNSGKHFLASNCQRFYCIRYNDSLVVGVVGSLENTIKIWNKIEKFVANNLKLILSFKKVLITHFIHNYSFFLNTLIKSSQEKEKLILIIKKKHEVFKKVRIIPKIVFKAPIKKIFKRIASSGFFKKKAGKYIPTYVGRYINLNHQNILHLYNFVIRKILNDYSIVNNKKLLGMFINRLKLSCARTLALKYKLRYACKIYKKFGSKLKSPNGGIELHIPLIFKAIKKVDNNY